MRGLTLIQPWASLVALGHKRVETRSWRTAYRGPVLIHAAKGFPRWARECAEVQRALGRLPQRIPLSAVVAVADLTECRPAADVALEVTALERHLGDYTPGRWAWTLANVRPLALPIPGAGKLGLWKVSASLEGEVMAGLDGVRHAA